MPLSLSNKKKLRNTLFAALIIILLLTTRVAYIQFLWGPELSGMASAQQAQSRAITAKRGTIYDSTGKYILATSSSVESVNVNPTNIPSELKEKVSTAKDTLKEKATEAHSKIKEYISSKEKSTDSIEVDDDIIEACDEIAEDISSEEVKEEITPEVEE